LKIDGMRPAASVFVDHQIELHGLTDGESIGAEMANVAAVAEDIFPAIIATDESKAAIVVPGFDASVDHAAILSPTLSGQR
jgi:hypothetical protein